MRAIRNARAAVRERVWALAGEWALGAEGGLYPLDLDHDRGCAFGETAGGWDLEAHVRLLPPMTAFIDHGPGGTGEAAALLLRKGNAGSNTARDHITAGRVALAQSPARVHKQVLIRTDSGGGTHGFLEWVTSRRLRYSIGFTLTDDICDVIGKVPEHAWRAAYDADKPVGSLHDPTALKKDRG